MIPPLVLVVWIGRIPIVVPVVLLWPLLAVAWTSARIWTAVPVRSPASPRIEALGPRHGWTRRRTRRRTRTSCAVRTGGPTSALVEEPRGFRARVGPVAPFLITATRIFVSLRGLKIDLRSKDGPPIGVRLY